MALTVCETAEVVIFVVAASETNEVFIAVVAAAYEIAKVSMY